jgi:MFS family permease
MTTKCIRRAAAGSNSNPWIICFIAGLFFFYEFIQMSVFNAIGGSLLKDFSIHMASLGTIAASYSYTMVIFLFPAGVLLDSFSPKKILICAFSLSILGTLLFSFSTTAHYAEICRMISGVGGAFAFIGCIKIASRWFGGSKMSLVVGLLITFAFLGGAIAQTPFTVSTQLIGWRNTLRMLALFGLISILLISLFVQDGKKSLSLSADKNVHTSFFKKIIFSLLNMQTFIGGIYIMLMNLPIVLLGALWGGFYLTQARHFSHIQSSYIDTMLFFGIMAGSPLFGFISDKMQKRKPVLFFGSIFTALISFLLFGQFSSPWVYAILFLLLGFFSSAQGVGYPCIVENNSIDLAGTASGIASIIIMGGGALFKVLFGWVLDQHWHGAFENKIPLYSSRAFNHAMIILPASFLTAFLCVFFIRETLCQPLKINENG